MDAEVRALLAIVRRLDGRRNRRDASKHRWETNAPKEPDRAICGAMTRKGTPCRAKSEPGKRRCRFHGGLSTGPKTEAGREAIRESNRRRARGTPKSATFELL